MEINVKECSELNQWTYLVMYSQTNSMIASFLQKGAYNWQMANSVDSYF